MLGAIISKLMCRLVLTNHQRYLLIHGIKLAIGDYSLKIAIHDKRDATYIRACKEQIDALNELEEALLKCESYYEEV